MVSVHIMTDRPLDQYMRKPLHDAIRVNLYLHLTYEGPKPPASLIESFNIQPK